MYVGGEVAVQGSNLDTTEYWAKYNGGAPEGFADPREGI